MPSIDKKYYHNLDLDSNEIKAGRIYNLTTTQRNALSLSTADKGYLVYDTTLLSLFVWDGTAWTSAGAAQDLQEVVNVNNSITNAIVGYNATISSLNVTSDRVLYLNDDTNPTIRIVDNLDSNHYTTIDIDTLNLNGASYNWQDIIVQGIYVALPFTTDHLAVTNNPYVIGDAVWYLGNVYRCLANNDSILPTSTLYWTNIGAGYPLIQQPVDWNSTNGNNQILNKPIIPTGTVTNVTATSPITSSGGTTPVISTSMATNKLIGRYSTSTGVMEEITVGSGLTLTGAGVLNNTATPTPTGYYGAFQDVTNQFATVINTGYPMLLGITDLSNQVTVVSGSRVTIANTGIYNIQWSAQFTNPTALEHDVTIWLRKNGVDVPGSSGVVLVPPKHGSSDGHVLPSWNFLLDPIAGDYYEFVWSTVNISVYISFEPAGNPPPSTASVILTVTQQAGIMAGTGITAINSLTGSAQTLTTGTTGTDFAIVDSGTDHKFNLPIASATNTGKLSSTDWTTFNSKGDMILASTQTNSGAKTFLDTTFLLRNVANTFNGSFVNTNTADRIYTLPNATGTIALTSDLSNYVTYSGLSSQLYRIVNNVDSATTNATVLTLIYSQLIPANTFAAGDVIRLSYRGLKTGGTAGNNAYFYINTSSTVSGATLLGQYSSALGIRMVQVDRKLYIKNTTTNTEIYNTAVSAFAEFTPTNTSVYTNSSINWTIDQYIIFANTLNNATDSWKGSSYEIERIRTT